MPEAIGVRAGPSVPFEDGIKATRQAGALELLAVSHGYNLVHDLFATHIRDVDPLPVTVGAQALARPVAPSEPRQIDNPDNRALFPRQGEDGAIERHAMSEALRAIDRIDEPSKVARSTVAPLFLALDQVTRPSIPDPAPGLSLDGEIDIGDDAAARLGMDRKALFSPSANQFPHF
jgi:hypothetical protein